MSFTILFFFIKVVIVSELCGLLCGKKHLGKHS